MWLFIGVLFIGVVALIVVIIKAIVDGIESGVKKSKQKKNLMEYVQIRENFIKDTGFHCTKHIWVSSNREIMIDDEHELIAFRGYNMSSFSTMKYSELQGYDVKEQGHSILQGNTGGALIGGLAFGVAGAIAGGSGNRKSVGMTSDLTVYLMTDNMTNPVVRINFIETPEQIGSSYYADTYNRMKTFVGILDLILKQNEKSTTQQIKA